MSVPLVPLPDTRDSAACHDSAACLEGNCRKLMTNVSLCADISATAVTDNSRTLQFNLSSSIDAADKITAIDLVLKQEAGVSSYETHLHEISGDEDTELKLLDSGVYRGEWHTLHVQNLMDSVDGTSGKRNYNLLLSVSGGAGEGTDDLLRRVKPMLLIYTNDMNRTGGETVPTHDGYPVIGRDRSGFSSSKEYRSRDPRTRSNEQDDTQSNRRRRNAGGESGTMSLAEKRQLTCRVQETTTTFGEDGMGWPGSQYMVLTPSVARFSFCLGTCNDPFSTTVNYTNHAKLIGLNQPDLADITPCCVALEFTPLPIMYVSLVSRVTTMTTYPIARSCRCT